jgi:hypothetical protein
MRKWILIECYALLLLLAGGWYLYSPTVGNSGEGEEPAGRFWHCPNCGLELPCPPKQEDKVTLCPHCIREKIAFEVVTHRSDRWGLPVGVNGYLLVAGASLLAVLAITAWLGDRVRQGSKARQDARRSDAPGTAIG